MEYMQTVHRLIEKFIPDNYQLSLEIERKERVFKGIVTITGSSTGSQDIVLHAKDLDIENITLDGKKTDFSFGQHDEITITHPDLKEGKHILVIAFSGKITDA